MKITMSLRKAFFPVLLAVAVFATVPADDALAKARHPKSNGDGSGIFIPPAPETEPVFVMATPHRKLKIANADPRNAEPIPKYAPPTGPAMGNEAPPMEESRASYPIRTVDSLQMPLLFR